MLDIFIVDDNVKSLFEFFGNVGNEFGNRGCIIEVVNNNVSFVFCSNNIVLGCGVVGVMLDKDDVGIGFGESKGYLSFNILGGVSDFEMVVSKEVFVEFCFKVIYKVVFFVRLKRFCK